jgi:hypothetical protein
MHNRLSPALLIRETKQFVLARKFHLNREPLTAFLLGLAIVVFFCLPNRDQIAFEAVQIGMSQETLVRTLAGLKSTATHDRYQETRTWRDRVKFPLRAYQVTVRDGKVVDKRILP